MMVSCSLANWYLAVAFVALQVGVQATDYQSSCTALAR